MEGGRGCGDALPSGAGGVGVVLSQPPGCYSSWTHAGVLHRCLDCVTDDATHLAVKNQVSHWSQ